MSTILNRLTSFVAAFWAKYRKFPPTVQIAGGLAAVVVLAKFFWPLAFVAIIVTTVVLLQQKPVDLGREQDEPGIPS